MRAFFHSHANWYVLTCIALTLAIGFRVLHPHQAATHPIEAVSVSEPEVHYVTPRQLTDSAALSATAVSGVTAITDRGQQFTWPRSDESRPLLLIFIKSGCPCSVEMEPFFHRLCHAYADVASFAGVIDADVDTARKYAAANGTPYPILADAKRKIIDQMRAENGVYVALIVAENSLHPSLKKHTQAEPAIDTLWPGCSTKVFAEMGERIAKTTGVTERPLDVSDLPGALVTGCPFPRSIR